MVHVPQINDFQCTCVKYIIQWVIRNNTEGELFLMTRLMHACAD